MTANGANGPISGIVVRNPLFNAGFEQLNDPLHSLNSLGEDSSDSFTILDANLAEALQHLDSVSSKEKESRDTQNLENDDDIASRSENSAINLELQNVASTLGIPGLDLSNLENFINAACTNSPGDPSSNIILDPDDPASAALFIAQQVVNFGPSEHESQSQNESSEVDFSNKKLRLSNERMKEENRARKRRWRECNEDRNKDNDLRCRVNKRANQLFGNEDTKSKLDWIEYEFQKRRNRRLEKIKSSDSIFYSKTDEQYPSDQLNNALTSLAANPSALNDLLQKLASESLDVQIDKINETTAVEEDVNENRNDITDQAALDLLNALGGGSSVSELNLQRSSLLSFDSDSRSEQMTEHRSTNKRLRQTDDQSMSFNSIAAVGSRASMYKSTNFNDQSQLHQTLAPPSFHPGRATSGHINHRESNVRGITLNYRIPPISKRRSFLINSLGFPPAPTLASIPNHL